MLNENHLIYGKNSLTRIVGMEVVNDVLEIYREFPDGSNKTEFYPNRFWILSSENFGKGWIRLKGDLHYKWGKQFTNRGDFMQFRHFAKQDQRDIYSIYDNKEAIMVKDGYTYFKDMKINEVSILSFDIEATTLKQIDDSKLLLISNTFRKNGKTIKKLFSYDEYQDEGKMIDAWCKWVRQINPAIICGHNIFSYDLPYLNFIAERYNTKLFLGRDASYVKFDKHISKFRKDQSQDLHYNKAHIFGREIIDTLFLAIKYDIATKKYESYGLKNIIAQENLVKSNRVFYDSSKIRYNYKNQEEWNKIKAYCVDDSDDALSLFDLMAPSYFYMCQSVPKSFELLVQSATGSQINSIMLRAYLQEMHSLPKAYEAVEYEGAISFGNPGIFKNVWKVDVASLYPSIMIEYEVYDKEKDPKEYFKYMVKTFTEKRLEYKSKAKKEKYYDDLQAAYKIFINSCYGFLGTKGLLFNSPSNAAFITKKGREILNKAITWAKDNGFEIVNADTDSISITKNNGEYLSKDTRQTLLESLCNLYPKRIKWEDDGYYTKLIVLAGKNYILKTEDGKVKYKGSAIKATTKEKALSEFIKRILDAMLNEHINYLDIYNEYVKEILNLKDIYRWVTRKTITDKVLNPKRTNEQKVKDAFEGSEYSEGDRIYTFFKSDNSLCLVENFNGDYSIPKLLKKLHDTVKIFKEVMDVTQFPNYSLKNKKMQEKLNEFRSDIPKKQESLSSQGACL